MTIPQSLLFFPARVPAVRELSSSYAQDASESHRRLPPCKKETRPEDRAKYKLGARNERMRGVRLHAAEGNLY
jgi:hypothetical protein